MAPTELNWPTVTDADPAASLIYWQAQVSGSHYVEVVEGWLDATGTYTVAVTALDVVDDHSRVLEGATPVAVGDAMAGDIQYATDIDYFVFEAELGRLYQIDITLETLPHSVSSLRDSDGFWLVTNDDTAAPRLYWQARASGSLYVAVESWLGYTGTYTTGTYTVAVTALDVVDDHSDAFEGGHTGRGRAMQWPGDIQYETDIDYFVFEAEQGQPLPDRHHTRNAVGLRRVAAPPRRDLPSGHRQYRRHSRQALLLGSARLREPLCRSGGLARRHRHLRLDDRHSIEPPAKRPFNTAVAQACIAASLPVQR